MKLAQVLKYEGREIRVVAKDSQPWWVLADICEILDIGTVNKVAERLDEDEKGKYSILTPGGKQEMLIVNEPGLYSLILTSRKPEAKEFKRWVTHDVLPSIAKRGKYITPEQKAYNKKIRAWAKKAEKIFDDDKYDDLAYRSELIDEIVELIAKGGAE